MALEQEVNQKIDEVAQAYSVQLIEAGNIAWNKVSRLIDESNDGTNHIGGLEGNHTGTAIALAMTGAIQSSRVNRALERMKNQLDPIRRTIRNFYEDKFESETPYNAVRMATGLTESTKNFLDSELSETQFDVHVKSDIMAAWNRHYETRSTIAATKADMQHRITLRMETWSQNRVFTILQQHSRDQNEIFGGAFSDRVVYTGPQDDENRDFCADRLAEQDRKKSKSFSIDEVKLWPQLHGPWDGMIPSTNASNIFINAGGFNCRHIFEYE